MGKYFEIFINGYSGYANYLWGEITNPSFHNYFYWLIIVSLFFFALEIITPWRKKQKLFRQDFWLDLFYVFFNFFLFSLIIYTAVSDVAVNMLNDFILYITGGFNLMKSNPLNSLPYWAILFIGFVFRDFVQWWIHRLLHRVPRLWEYHKVHHSVKEMGFAAHLRYHWMENVLYKGIEYIPLALLGLGLYDFFIIHIFTLAWGHYNHSNISINGKVTGGIVGTLIGIVLAFNLLEVNLFLDPSTLTQILVVFASGLIGVLLLGRIMKYLFNSPEMHIWHHVAELPEGHKYGINYGLTLAIWDYIFKTASIPKEGRDIELGFPDVENFPKKFWKQNIQGF